MSKKAYNKIAEGLKEAIAITRGASEPARLNVPQKIDVRSIRAKLGLSQELFSGTYGFTLHQIRQWEQGRSQPLGAMRAYLMIIDRNPREVLNLLRSVKTKRAPKAA